MKSYRYIIISLFLISACSTKNETKLTLHIRGAFNRHYYIQSLAFNDERQETLDSGIAKTNSDSIVFYIPYTEDKAFQLRVEGRDAQTPFINDSKEIDIYYDNTTGTYRVKNSPASILLKNFSDSQSFIMNETVKLKTQINSLSLAKKANKRKIDSLTVLLDTLSRSIYNRNFQFADTVHNPAVFMVAYNLVEFGKDFAGLHKFIDKAKKRFPGHKGVQLLAENTLEFIKIFEEEYQIGDKLPELVLPNQYDKQISTYSIKNKYLLIDFWSTWCETCRVFSAAKKEARKRIDSSRFDMISVAVDAEKATWHKVIDFEGYTWDQLIDEKMWNGKAVRTLKFDSIPFNFLIDPNRRIIAKAIPADSLVIVLEKLVKKK